MAKRFTDSGKFRDPWFRLLKPAEKLGYLYLLDECDQAGVVDLDRELGEFQIGEKVDWDGLIDGSEGRIEKIDKRKLWMTKFVPFQCGKLSEDCRAHKPVFDLLKRYGLLDRVLKDYQTPTSRVQEKEQEKEKKRNKKKKPDFDFEDPGLNEAVADWLKFKTERRQGYTETGRKQVLGAIRNRSDELGPNAVVRALRSAMANNYAGWEHQLDGNGNRQKAAKRATGEVEKPSTSIFE